MLLLHLAGQHGRYRWLPSLIWLLPLLAALVGAILNTWNRFSVPAFAPTFLNVSMIGFALFAAPHFNPPVLALASVLLIVVREITTRGVSVGMRSSTIAFSAALFVTVAAPFLPAEGAWRWPTLAEWTGLAIATGFLAIGYQTAVAVMRVGEVGFVSPFRYTSLLFAILLGVVVFGDWPDGWTWAGSALVVAAGIYSIWREAQLRQGAG